MEEEKRLGVFEGEKPRESTPCPPSEHRRVLCYGYWLVRSGGETFYLSPMSLTLRCEAGIQETKGPICLLSPPLNTLDSFLKDSTYRSDLADLTLKLRGIAGPTERTLLYWLSTVDGPIRCSTDVERVVHVIIELIGICGVFLTGRQDFAGLREGRNVLFKRTENRTPQLKWPQHHGLAVSLMQEATVLSEYRICPPHRSYEGIITAIPIVSGFFLFYPKVALWN